MTQDVIEEPLNTPLNDLFLPGNTTELPQSAPELPQGTSPADTPFELHIRDRVIVISMVNVLKGVRDAYIPEHTFFLLRSTLCLMVDVPIAAAYLQKNEKDGPPIFFWLLDMTADIRRTSGSSRSKSYLDAVFKCPMDVLNPAYRSEPNCLYQIHYSWFKHN